MTPGSVTYITKLLFRNGVNILDAFLGYGDIIMVVDDKDGPSHTMCYREKSTGLIHLRSPPPDFFNHTSDAQGRFSRSQPSETSLLHAELGGRQFMGVGGSGTSAWDFHYSTQYGKHGSMRHSTFRLKRELEVLVG